MTTPAQTQPVLRVRWMPVGSDRSSTPHVLRPPLPPRVQRTQSRRSVGWIQPLDRSKRGWSEVLTLPGAVHGPRCSRLLWINWIRRTSVSSRSQRAAHELHGGEQQNRSQASEQRPSHTSGRVAPSPLLPSLVHHTQSDTRWD
jgi:hypothetical protein